jgi:hypothetical protein
LFWLAGLLSQALAQVVVKQEATETPTTTAALGAIGRQKTARKHAQN